jgi:transcriptional regulator with XRE-family HTH domain
LSLKRLNWSKLLKELREEAGMTQKDLAYKARMPQRTVAEYENVGADRQLSIYKIETILDVLGYEVEVFLKET